MAALPVFRRGWLVYLFRPLHKQSPRRKQRGACILVPTIHYLPGQPFQILALLLDKSRSLEFPSPNCSSQSCQAGCRAKQDWAWAQRLLHKPANTAIGHNGRPGFSPWSCRFSANKWLGDEEEPVGEWISCRSLRRVFLMVSIIDATCAQHLFPRGIGYLPRISRPWIK